MPLKSGLVYFLDHLVIFSEKKHQKKWTLIKKRKPKRNTRYYLELDDHDDGGPKTQEKKGIKKGEKRSSDASLVPASTYTEHPTI